MTEESPIEPLAKPEDLDFNLAVSACRWTSHTPEDRARRTQQAYAEAVNGFHAEMRGLAKTEEQKAILAAEIERYRQNYLQHYGALLQAESRTASPMITGPANFPVERNRKRMETADKRRGEFLEWDERAREAVERKVLDARTPEEKTDDRWQELSRDIRRSLTEILAIDEHGSPFTRASFVNSIAGKVERLAESGEVALVERAVAQVKAYNDEHKKPAISSRHTFWTLPDLARQKSKEHDAALDAEPTTLVEGEGIRIVENKSADRVQIFFPGKPDEAMRARLKGEGWRFSPAEEAWQRKLTNAAVYSAKKITGLGL